MPEQDPNKVYKILDEFQQTLSEAGFGRKEIDVKTEIDKINLELKKMNNVLIGVIVVLVVMVLGILIDTVIFHYQENKSNIQMENLLLENIKK